MVLLVMLPVFIIFFYDWKVSIILVPVNSIIQNNTVVPFVEKILGMTIDKIVKKVDNKKKKCVSNFQRLRFFFRTDFASFITK